jgi:hypothetical protein
MLFGVSRAGTKTSTGERLCYFRVVGGVARVERLYSGMLGTWDRESARQDKRRGWRTARSRSRSGWKRIDRQCCVWTHQADRQRALRLKVVAPSMLVTVPAT